MSIFIWVSSKELIDTVIFSNLLLNLRKRRKVSVTPCFRPVITGHWPGQVLTAHNLMSAPGGWWGLCSNDATGSKVKILSQKLPGPEPPVPDALISFLSRDIRYYRSDARTHISGVITLSMTHFNAPVTPVHQV